MDYRYGNGTTEDAGATFHIGCGGEICWFKEGPICSKCEASDDEPGSLDTLARNLAVAGGLCAAHRSGFDAGWSCSGEGFNAEYARPRDPNWYEKMYADSTVNDYTGERDCWRPGCGRAVR
jgi:hypothetical protein